MVMPVNSWAWEPIWVRNERQRRSIEDARLKAQPYLATGQEADQHVAASIMQRGVAQGQATYDPIKLAAQQVMAGGNNDLLSVLKEQSTAKTAQQPQRKAPGGSLWGAITAPFSDARDLTSDVAHGRFDMGTLGDLGGLGMSTLGLTDIPGRYVARPLIEATTGLDIQGIIDNPDTNPFVRALLDAGTNPLTYLTPAMLAKTGLSSGTGLVANLLSSPLKVSAGAVVGQGIGAEVGSRVAGEKGEMVGSIVGGFAGGFAAGPISQVLRGGLAAPFRVTGGNRLIADDGVGNALVHQLQLAAGTETRPLSPAELGALERGQRTLTEIGYQPSFAEAIPNETPLGVPIRWTSGGVVPGVGETPGYSEFFGPGWHQFEQPHIFVNDTVMSAPPSSARDLAIRLRMVAHEDAHGLWNTLDQKLKDSVAEQLNLPPDPLRSRVLDDMTKRWGAPSPEEAFAEAFASRQAGQDTPYSRLLGAQVREAVANLSPEAQRELKIQQRQLTDWGPKLDEAALAMKDAPSIGFQSDDAVGNWYWVSRNGEQAGFITKDNGKWRAQLMGQEGPAPAFNSLSEAQQYVLGKQRTLMPFGKGEAPTPGEQRRVMPQSSEQLPADTAGAELTFRKAVGGAPTWTLDTPNGKSFGSIYNDGENVFVATPSSAWNERKAFKTIEEATAFLKSKATVASPYKPLARERVWFHGTSSTAFDTPDPMFGTAGITQGPGVYLAADPSVSSGYGNRLFATEFDGSVSDLTRNIAPTEPMFEGGPSWEDIRKAAVRKIEELNAPPKTVADVQVVKGTGFRPDNEYYLIQHQGETIGNVTLQPDGQWKALSHAPQAGDRTLVAGKTFPTKEAATEALVATEQNLRGNWVARERSASLFRLGKLADWDPYQLQRVASERAKLRHLDVDTGAANGYTYRDALAWALAPAAEADPVLKGQFESVVKEHGLAAINSELAENGVDAVFHHSPAADGDVLIVLNGEKARVRADIPTYAASPSEQRLPAGATIEDIKKGLREDPFIARPMEKYTVDNVEVHQYLRADGKRVEVRKDLSPDNPTPWSVHENGNKPTGSPVATEAEAMAIVQSTNQEPRFYQRGPGEEGRPLDLDPNVVPIPDPQATQERLGRLLKRAPEVGLPKNERIVVNGPNGPLVVGKATPTDLVDLVKRYVTPEEMDAARYWYEDLNKEFDLLDPQEKLRFTIGWLSSQPMASPSQGFHNVLRAADEVAGLPQMKKAGLNAENLKLVLSGKRPKSGVGVKLYDFIDSASLKKTRTIMGDDTRAGAPSVMDVWSGRAAGLVDEAMARWVAQFDPELAKSLKKDVTGSGWSESSYEAAADLHRRATNMLNDMAFDGGEWTPAQLQAAGWWAVQKAMGSTPESAGDIIAKNLRRIGFELRPGEGSPLAQKYDWSRLTSEQSSKVTDTVLTRVVDFVHQHVPGARIVKRVNRPGGWHEDISPSWRIDVLASEETAADVADVIGFLAQQDAVMVARPKKSGNMHAVDIALGKGVDVEQLWAGLRRLVPDLAEGFQASEFGDGREAIRIYGKFGSKNYAKLKGAIVEVSHELDGDIDVTPAIGAEVAFPGNNWKEAPDGQGYLSGLASRRREGLQRTLQDNAGLSDQWLSEAWPTDIGGPAGSAAGAGPSLLPGSAGPADDTVRRLMAGGSVDEPGGPTFLGMQPSEIAAILGVDDANPTLFKRLEELDGLYRNGQLKGSAVKERADLSKVLRDAYRQRNDGRAPVWVLPPGYRETWATKMEARVAAMRQAGWSEEQITSALPDYKLANPAVPSAQRTASTTKPPVSHTTSEYLGQERWKRVMALEKIASDPSVDSTTRYTARNGLFTELGVPFPKGDKVPELVRRSMQERMLMAGPSGAGRTSPAPAAGLQLAMDGFAAEPGSRVQSASRKAWQTAVDIAGLPRTLISSIDMGGIARQGGILGVSYPREWREAIAAQFKALRSEAGAEALAKARQADGYFQVLKANGLYESPWGNTLADLSAREENFMSTLASKIPGIRASERSYAEGLNQQRWLTGAHILADWEADAGSLAAIPRQRIEALTKLLNVASGRGEIPAALRAPVFNNLLFSPRFLASRFELIGMAMNGGGSPEVRRIAQKMLARYLGTGVAILTMASAAGIGGTSLDPNSSDFGKLKIGNTRYDMWGGYQPIFRYMANFATGKSSSGQPQDRLTTLGKFARTKLAPVPGDVVNILKGETMLGEELSPSAGTARDIFIQNTVPLFLQDAAQAFLDEGFVGVVKTAPGFVGLGTQTYIPRTQQLDEKAKALAAGNPTAYPDGVKGFFDLQPKDRDAIKQADPRLWQEYVAEGSDQLKRSEGLRAELETKQQSLDDQLLAGALPVEEWEKGYRALRDELRYRRKEIYGDKPMTQDDIKTPLDAFYFTLQQVDDGVLTQQQADDWKAKLPAEDQKYIDDNTGLGGTALVRLYKSVQAKYYSIPRYLGYTADEGDQMSQLATYARESAGGNQQRALSLVTRYGAGMPARVLSGARRIIMGGTMAPRVNPARSTFRASNPGAVLLGGGYLDGTTVSKLKVALGSSRAA